MENSGDRKAKEKVKSEILGSAVPGSGVVIKSTTKDKLSSKKDDDN